MSLKDSNNDLSNILCDVDNAENINKTLQTEFVSEPGVEEDYQFEAFLEIKVIFLSYRC